MLTETSGKDSQKRTDSPQMTSAVLPLPFLPLWNLKAMKTGAAGIFQPGRAEPQNKDGKEEREEAEALLTTVG